MLPTRGHPNRENGEGPHEHGLSSKLSCVPQANGRGSSLALGMTANIRPRGRRGYHLQLRQNFLRDLFRFFQCYRFIRHSANADGNE
jgi:hypothetical protein